MCDTILSSKKPQCLRQSISECCHGTDDPYKLDNSIPEAIHWDEPTAPSRASSICSVSSSCTATTFNCSSLNDIESVPLSITVGDSYDTESDSEMETSSPTTKKIEFQVTITDIVRSDTHSTYDYNDSIPNSPQKIYSSPSSDFYSSQTQRISSVESDTKQQETLRLYQDIHDEYLDVYHWQKPIQNEVNYGPFHVSFQKEVLNNPYFTLSKGDFNDILKKCQFIKSRWLGEKIRSTRCGTIGTRSWNSGAKITESELFAVKLYTDFEVCQRELKKCYRPPMNGNKSEMNLYEQRLCYFGHWRRLLNVAIMKYGTLLNDRVFYHGINQVMSLDIHPTNRCHGPISATPDIEIARGFATNHGVILQMMSKYPRLGTDYYFDAASISAYPDEKEYLIGFMYTRILHVLLGCSELDKEDIDEEMVLRVTCFIISSLIKHNLYSFGPYIEIIFLALLITDDEYNDYIQFETARDKAIIQCLTKMIPTEIKNEFRRSRNNKKVLKLDIIGDTLKALFCNDEDILSMSKIHTFTPNITELQLHEEHEINNEFIDYFLEEVSNTNINTIKVFKYAFEGSSKQFQYKESISDAYMISLQNEGWYIYEYHNKNAYKFMLTKQQMK